MNFDHWTAEDGLPHNTVRKIVQTPDGYLWITTFDGLSRFDGVRFTNFNSVNTQEITDNRFYDAFVEKDGTLWVSLLNGSVLRYKNKEFKSFEKIKEFAKREEIIFRTDENEKIIFRTDDGWRYFGNGEFPLVPEKSQPKQKLSCIGNKGKIWTLNSQGVTENYKENTTNYQIDFDNFIKFEDVPGFRCLEDKNGALWFGDYQNLYKLKDGETTKIKITDEVLFQSQTIVQPQIEDNEGYIWFTQRIRHSVKVYRIKDGKIEVLEKEIPPEFYQVSDIFKDREGIIWIGSIRGFFRVRSNFVEVLSSEDGLAKNQVYSILEKRNSEKIIGSDESISLYKDGKFKQIFEDIIVYSLWEDENGKVWIATNGGYDKAKESERLLMFYENGEFKSAEYLNKGEPKVIKGDDLGNIWIGTIGGLSKVRNDKLIKHYTTKDGLPNKPLTFIHKDKKGTLWVGTTDGLVKFQDEKFVPTEIKDRIRTIYEDEKGVLWIGTYGKGIIRFDSEFFRYTTENGLYHNGAFQFFEDENENFWIGGNQGIYRVAKQELNDYARGKIKRVNSYPYNKQDGMLNAEVNGGRQPAGIIASDGNFWFPTMDGIAIINPKKIQENRILPNALIEEVSIEREKTDFQDGVTVGVGKDDLEIVYTGLSLVKPKQIKFKYKLEGFNEKWIEIGTRRAAYYSYLPPGNYTFRLVAANSDGVWSDKETTLKINVLAPFYRTNWFYTLVVFTIIGIAFLLYRYRINQLEKRNAEQMAFSRQLISLQESERKRIAAGLHDGLSHHLIMIKNWTTIAKQILKTGETVDDQLEEISETSLQALNEVREITNDLRPHRIENLGLTDTIESMIEKVESSSGINFDFEADVIDHLLSKEDEVIFYRIIQEYVNNIVKHSEAQNASISIKNGSNQIKVKITDDGKGFNIKEKPTSKKQGGFGLTGIGERLKMLGGVQTVKSDIGKGTEIDIKIELH